MFVASLASDAILEFDSETGAFVEDFTSGTGLDGPRTLIFGPHGDLFVCNDGSNSVSRFDGETGAFSGTFAIGNGLDHPYDLIFKPTPIQEATSANFSQTLGTGSEAAATVPHGLTVSDQHLRLDTAFAHFGQSGAVLGSSRLRIAPIDSTLHNDQLLLLLATSFADADRDRHHARSATTIDDKRAFPEDESVLRESSVASLVSEWPRVSLPR